MNINEIIQRMETVTLAHKVVKGFYVGNTWEMAASKSSDIYPAVWVEFPILVNYNGNDKVYTFSFDVLMLPKQDDVWDELDKISQCEAIADQLTQAYKLKIKGVGFGRMTGLTVKNLNADIACGVRVDMDVTTNKECYPMENFKENLTRI